MQEARARRAFPPFENDSVLHLSSHLCAPRLDERRPSDGDTTLIGGASFPSGDLEARDPA